MSFARLFGLVCVACSAVASTISMGWAADPAPETNRPFSKDDRVVFIGGGFVERMQQQDWLEAMLTVASPGTKFRNVGWSGDTVFGEARAVFGSKEDGYTRLLRDIELAKPTVSLICYGENDCWAGSKGIDAFRSNYLKLIEHLKSINSRVIVLIPRLREGHPEIPESPAAQYNVLLKQYNESTRTLCKSLNIPVVDLENFESDKTLTTDGVYWNSQGYYLVSQEICKKLGFSPTLSMTSHDDLRAKINQKNGWFFHRYRPQNETYLFLFRKHEQGNNAAELEQIEPQISSYESDILKSLLGK